MNEDDARLSGDEKLPDAPLVRPYVESLGEVALPKVAPNATPASALSAAEAPTPADAPTAPQPRISLTNRKHGARGRAPLTAGADVTSGQLPPPPTRARVVIAAGIAIAALVTGYAIWSPSSGSSRASSAPPAAIAPSVPMLSASPSTSPAPSRTIASSGARPPRTPSPSARSSKSTAPLSGPGSPHPQGVNLAAGRPVTDTGHNDDHVAANAVDGNPDTYWESMNGDFPQSITVDLGASMTVSRLVLRLPPSPSWNKRTQSLSIRSSRNRGNFRTIVAKASLTFDPDSGNQATITFSGTDCRYVRLTFMANSESPAGQASEIELFSS